MQSNGNGTEVWEKGIQVDLPDGEYEIEVQLTGEAAGRLSHHRQFCRCRMRKLSLRLSGAVQIMII